MNEKIRSNSTNINSYPGHMAKARREIKEKIDLIDIVYEVIDARMPLSSKVKDIDTLNLLMINLQSLKFVNKIERGITK